MNGETIKYLKLSPPLLFSLKIHYNDIIISLQQIIGNCVWLAIVLKVSTRSRPQHYNDPLENFTSRTLVVLPAALDNLSIFVISLVGVQLSETKMVLRTRAGQKAVLECDPQGDQPITVSWTRHGSAITSEQQKYFKVNKLKETTKYFLLKLSNRKYQDLDSLYFQRFSNQKFYCFKSADLRNRNNATIDQKVQFNWCRSWQSLLKINSVLI